MKKVDILKSYITECSVLRLSELETLRRLSDKGYKISRAYYYRLLKQIRESRFDRLHKIAMDGLIDSHLNIIDSLNQIQSEYWKQYHDCKDPIKKAQILKMIEDLQFSISSYMDASQYIYERSMTSRMKKKLEQQQEESISST